jgi:hypothetical protein
MCPEPEGRGPGDIPEPPVSGLTKARDEVLPVHQGGPTARGHRGTSRMLRAPNRPRGCPYGRRRHRELRESTLPGPGTGGRKVVGRTRLTFRFAGGAAEGPRRAAAAPVGHARDRRLAGHRQHRVVALVRQIARRASAHRPVTRSGPGRGGGRPHRPARSGIGVGRGAAVRRAGEPAAPGECPGLDARGPRPDSSRLRRTEVRAPRGPSPGSRGVRARGLTDGRFPPWRE